MSSMFSKRLRTCKAISTRISRGPFHRMMQQQAHGPIPKVHSMFDKITGSWSFILEDTATRKAAIIDPILGYDPLTGKVNTDLANGLISELQSKNLTLVHILETHAHADHLSAAYYIKHSFGRGTVPVGIGKRIREVQDRFGKLFGVPPCVYQNAFDHLFEDDEEFVIGELKIKALHLPGHTADHIGYLCGDAVFTGDTIFQPDVGSARCDFPAGDANRLIRSVEKLLSLPPEYKIYQGHDYPPSDREARPFSTVAEQQAKNIHFKNGTNLPEFPAWRASRDSSLNLPRLFYPSLQSNICAGRPPFVDRDHGGFVRTPLSLPSAFQNIC